MKNKVYFFIILLFAVGCENNITNYNNPAESANVIIFQSNDDIYSMNLSGNMKSNLTPELSGIMVFSDISLIQQKILFGNYQPDTITMNHQYILYSMSLNGSNKTRLDKSNVRYSNPKFSPDGSMIALIGQDSDNIYLIKDEQSEIENITNNSGRKWNPVFTKDSENILYISESATGIMDIYKINLSTKLIVNLTNEGTLYSANYKFSHQGDKIFYVSNKDGQANIYKINLDGTGLIQLTKTFGNSLCDISASDTKILYYSWYENGYQIKTMNTDGTSEKVVASTIRPSSDYWRPNALFTLDENYILFTGYNEGNNEIYIVDAGGNNLKNLTESSASDVLAYVY